MILSYLLTMRTKIRRYKNILKKNHLKVIKTVSYKLKSVFCWLGKRLRPCAHNPFYCQLYAVRQQKQRQLKANTNCR